ncbi:MAG: hypothetical protein FVQ82_12875 [Planctomycetes bacterium]|nr:hypothetical protein [Planctomycetota bacterium]
MAKEKAQFIFATVKSINTEQRTIDVLASTADKDRDGDIIKPSAFKKNIKSFLANSVILACHQHRLQTGSSPVIGSAIPETVKITSEGLVFTMKFAKTALGEEYWILYRDGHMRAFSVGFIPVKWEDTRDDKGRCALRTYTEVELLEVSAVPVPSNPHALARAKGYFDDEDSKDAIAEAIKANNDQIKEVITESIKSHFDDVLDGLEEIKDLLVPDSDDLHEDKLGGSHDSDRSAGDKLKPEQIVEALKSVLNIQL